ncbi:hypothetical protein ACIQGW_09305 [Lysinibacillus xylanilyticus]
MSRLGQQIFFARKRSANVAAEAVCCSLQGLNPQGVASLHSNQLIHIVDV